MKVILFGCGALGSNIAVEIAKRASSTTKETKLILIDYQTVEERNLAAQAFDPCDLGKPKAVCIKERINGYSYVKAESIVEKITEDNLNLIDINPSEYTIGIDCFDNLESRRLTYMFGYLNQIPIIHAGMSTQGTGQVTWNYKDYDTFPFSIKNISPVDYKKVKEKIDSENPLPPCELNGFRPLVLNTSLAAVEALFILMGIDVCRSVGDASREIGLMTNWMSNNKGYWLVKELNYKIKDENF